MQDIVGIFVLAPKSVCVCGGGGGGGAIFCKSKRNARGKVAIFLLVHPIFDPKGLELYQIRKAIPVSAEHQQHTQYSLTPFQPGGNQCGCHCMTPRPECLGLSDPGKGSHS
jgi:hypothetical protein